MSDLLDIAVRAWTPPQYPKWTASKSKPPRARYPRQLLVIDTETTTDHTQRLNFGAWRYCRVNDANGQITLTCVQEGLFYADDLPERDPGGYEILKRHATTSAADVDRRELDAVRAISVEPLEQWLRRVFWRAAYQLRAGVVCFNLPFDMSRLASHVGETRNRSRGDDPFAGGFSFVLWQYTRDGDTRESRHRPRLVIKALDSKRALKGFRKPDIPDPKNLIPEDADQPKVDPTWSFRGHLLDLRGLTSALTDRGHSLEKACKAFGVPYVKRDVEHGKITAEYIDYCREDVAATQDLAGATLAEFCRHPIPLQATRAHSAATIGRGYLTAIGVPPPLKRQEIDPKILGWAMSAYYGGRSEVRVRRVPLPVVYVDFLSMYPTVCALMGVWKLLTAAQLEISDATDEINALLETVKLDDCFNPALWPQLLGIAQVLPDGDVLPVRANYTSQPGWQIGVNPLRSDQPMWFTIPDLIASKVLTGKNPQILRAIRFKADGVAPDLKPVNLLGQVPVSPDDDFFKVVIEQRKRAQLRGTLEEDRRAKALKVLANSTSYGIYAQMTRRELGAGQTRPVTVYGYRDEPHTWSVSAPEEPGEYSFPPLAACITGAARLQLAMLEQLVTDLGGTSAFCDTDSSAIVATKQGGLIACAGGQHTIEDGQPAVRALSHQHVEEIRARFEPLNPYDPAVAPGSILELENENYTDSTRTERRQLHCFAISAKRYVLYQLDQSGRPIIVKASGHGLGHLLDPTDGHDDQWTDMAWEWLLRKHLGLPASEPAWLDHPAVARHAVSSPHLHRLFEPLNAGLPYAEQTKPFNFLNIAFVHPLERPPEDPRLVLIAPYRDTTREHLEQPWINRYSGKRYTITVEPSNGQHRPGVVTVKTYRDFLAEYAVHPEPKSNGSDEGRCCRDTVGILTRRSVDARTIRHTGKEGNRLEEAQAGLVQDANEILSSFDDPDQLAFEGWAIPILRELGVREVARRTEHSLAAVQAVLSGRATPRPRARQKYFGVASSAAAPGHPSRQTAPTYGQSP